MSGANSLIGSFRIPIRRVLVGIPTLTAMKDLRGYNNSGIRGGESMIEEIGTLDRRRGKQIEF
jgi:hypothetical protein